MLLFVGLADVVSPTTESHCIHNYKSLAIHELCLQFYLPTKHHTQMNLQHVKHRKNPNLTIRAAVKPH